MEFRETRMGHRQDQVRVLLGVRAPLALGPYALARGAAGVVSSAVRTTTTLRPLSQGVRVQVKTRITVTLYSHTV